MNSHEQHPMGAPAEVDVTGAPVHHTGGSHNYGGPMQQHTGGSHGGAPAHDAVVPAPAYSAAPPAGGSDMDRVKDKFHHAASDANKGDAAWATSFWDCFSPAELCFVTCCCPCVTFGKTHHRLEHAGDMSGYSPFNLPCVAFCGAMYVGLAWIGNMLQRGDLREKSHPKLSGDVATDCLRGFCCPCCDLMQQERESEALLARAGAVSHQPGPQQAMHYGPQEGGHHAPQEGMHHGPPKN